MAEHRFMSIPKSLDERIFQASSLAARARVNLDLFAFLTWQHNWDRFDRALGVRWNLFDFVRSANEHAFVARITNLFTERSDTDNFPHLISEAERLSVIDPRVCADIKTAVLNCEPAHRVVRRIRNKVVAHQDSAANKPTVYEQVKPTLDMFVSLSDASLSIADRLCRARGLVPQPAFKAPIEQLEAMLNDLQH